jgi:hypothetical protein
MGGLEELVVLLLGRQHPRVYLEWNVGLRRVIGNIILVGYEWGLLVGLRLKSFLGR